MIIYINKSYSYTNSHMPPKKSTAVVKKTVPVKLNLDVNDFQSSNNVKLLKVFEKLTKTLENVNKVQDEFNTSFASLQNYTEEELNNMDFTLRLKNEECYNSLQELTKQYKEREFQLNVEFEEKKYKLEDDYKRRVANLEREYETKEMDLAKELLTRENYTVVPNRDYNSMTSQISELETGREEFEKRVTADMHKELNARLKTQELQHNVNSSEMRARIDNQEREIIGLRETIESLKSEIQAQRDLTKEVAQATQRQLTQNFGK